MNSKRSSSSLASQAAKTLNRKTHLQRKNPWLQVFYLRETPTIKRVRRWKTKLPVCCKVISILHKQRVLQQAS